MASSLGFGHSSNPNEMFESNVLQEIAGIVPEGVIVRPLQKILGQLTKVGNIGRDQFNDRFESMRNTRPKSYYVVVIEDKETQKVVGAATLVIEYKFIHEAGCRGRVEDVVVDNSKRGMKLGALLNRVLVHLAKKVGVYKLSLECKDALIPFYELYGFKKDVGNNFLVQRFDNADMSMPGVPSLAALDYKFLSYDKEWKLHKLPKEDISVPRDHLPDPEAESIPSTKQDQTTDIERRWLDTGLSRIYMGPTSNNNS